jgi:hypothetical protein
MMTWRELFPTGRGLFYEGDDPDGFAATIKAEFGFDPSTDPRWGAHYDAQPGDPAKIDELRDWFDSDQSVPFNLENMPVREHTDYQFHCPAEFLDAIYGNNRFPLGS